VRHPLVASPARAAAWHKLMLRHAATAVFLLLALAARPSFADIAGQATVVDGDTIVAAVRLQSIGSPELHQTCTATAKSGRADRGGVAQEPPRQRQEDPPHHARA
jgi:endonuclease YncB( thermonuclease family)